MEAMPAEEWEAYLCLVDDKPAAMLVNLSLRLIAPDASRPYLAWVRLHLQQPGAEGLSEPAEVAQLNELEDKLLLALHEGLNALQTGRLTNAGLREVFWYLPTLQGFEKLANEALQGSGYTYELGGELDEQWNHYGDFLFPNEAQLRDIRNRHVLEHLVQQGDLLTRTRPVTHYFAFATEDALSSFMQLVIKEGYEVLSTGRLAEDPDLPYALELSRTSAVDPETISQLTEHLQTLAEAQGGAYDGWETAVVPQA